MDNLNDPNAVSRLNAAGEREFGLTVDGEYDAE